MAITDRTRKILWTKAGGRCSMCRILLVTEGTDTDDPSVFGEEAHIVARAENGPRAGEIADIDSYDNLILLCSKDHKRVDDQVGYYTVDRLKKIKQKHEEWVTTFGKTDLALTVADQLLGEPLSRLPPSDPFPGAGLYALYYLGDFPAYAPIAPPASGAGELPIYIGRAALRKARIEGVLTSTLQPVLYQRLREHATTLNQVQNLPVQEFRCRYLVTDDIWVPLAEALMIQQYQPVWNKVLLGFGLHDPGGGRRLQLRSEWDELHPGRPWTAKQPPAIHSPEESLARIAVHFSDWTRANR